MTDDNEKKILICVQYHRWFFGGEKEEAKATWILISSPITSSLFQQEALSQLWNHFVHRLDDVLHLGEIP